VAGNDSAIFSLGALAARASPSAASGPREEDDSGLIDLRAVERGRARAGPPAWGPAPVDLGLSPMDAPTPDPIVVVPARRPTVRRHARGEQFAVVTLSVAALVLASAVVFLLVRGPSPDARLVGAPAATITASIGGAAAAPPLPPPSAEPMPVTSASAQTPSVGRPSSSVVSTRAAKPTGSGHGQPAPGASASASSHGTGACPCPPNDLLCHMHHCTDR
jgi:hypothetical protein